jgi:heme-degrading monooxygenase HmoA
MIARHWTARATVEGARAYIEFFQRTLVPQLARLDGHRGALVFDRLLDDGVEVTVVTLWESMEAMARFAGSTPERAVVEPEVRAILRDCDDRVRLLTLRLDTATSRR